MNAAEVLVPASALLGEGPLWDATTGDIVWVDIEAVCIHRTSLATADLRTTRIGEPVGSLATTVRGGLVGATPTGIRNLDHSEAPHLARFPQHWPHLRANDGKVAPGGRFVVGTMGIDDQKPGTG